jgi:hypothetical protein
MGVAEQIRVPNSLHNPFMFMLAIKIVSKGRPHLMQLESAFPNPLLRRHLGVSQKCGPSFALLIGLKERHKLCQLCLLHLMGWS